MKAGSVGPNSSTLSPLAIQRDAAKSRICFGSIGGCALKSKPASSFIQRQVRGILHRVSRSAMKCRWKRPQQHGDVRHLP